MPTVTLPDGSQREYSNPLTIADVAADIESWLDGNALAGGSKFVEQQLELLKVRVGLRGREEGRLGESL